MGVSRNGIASGHYPPSSVRVGSRRDALCLSDTFSDAISARDQAQQRGAAHRDAGEGEAELDRAGPGRVVTGRDGTGRVLLL